MKDKFPNCMQTIGTSKDTLNHIRTVQASMEGSAGGRFLEPILHDLRVLVGFTIEFHYYLRLSCTHPFCLGYACDSIFSAVDSYQNLTHAYNALVNAAGSRIEWNNLSVPLLKEQFVGVFDEFEKETNFENKCRLLLDLFKLQIVFAGVSYDG